MGKNASKNKGDRAELEIARILHDLTGDNVRRKLGAGRSDDEGDLEGLTDTTAEVKAYADVLAAIRDGLADLEREQVNAGTVFGVLFVKRPRSGWIAVMTVEQWATWYREATA